uniref:Meiotic nuclear division protein 1 homolog n=1 Tax=Timema monikensis TaxID=170555 RepID=A0A7R9HS08_9NEOP|nr:unnamed protein product [Timema monikensis]
MSKRKGVSAEEKRKRLLEIFREKQEFFQLKELEKIAPKEKGIIAQSVKDVLQSLVDDGLVDSEKVGTSVYFWSYSNKSTTIKQRKLNNLSTKLEECKRLLQETKDSIAVAEIGRESTEERTRLLQVWAEKKSQEEDLKLKLQHYETANPERYLAMQEQTKVSKEAINRWTDNIFNMKSWCRNRFSIEESILNKQFEIDPDMDYLE